MENLINNQLTVTRDGNRAMIINYDFQNPPQVFFDTNVLVGLNPKGIAALKILQMKRGFTYRYSMLNFVELASHVGDKLSVKVSNPFRKFQAVFKKLVLLFNLKPLPSPESIFLKAVGLHDYLGPNWEVNEEEWNETIKFISEAESLSKLQQAGFSSEHYKKLRKLDEKWFLKFIEKARTLGPYPTNSQEIGPDWGRFLGQFYEFLIFRASSEKTTFSALKKEEKMRVLAFFDIKNPGGGIFLTHFVFLLKKILCDQKREDANDFYDMLQLLLLRNQNLLFVTDDRPFHQYYSGPVLHRVVSWKGFEASASLP